MQNCLSKRALEGASDYERIHVRCLCDVRVRRGRPFKQAEGAEAKGAEGMEGKPDSAWMGRLLMTVGCAVITILLFKRMHVA